jgi:hypothetical protein
MRGLHAKTKPSSTRLPSAAFLQNGYVATRTLEIAARARVFEARVVNAREPAASLNRLGHRALAGRKPGN